MKDSPCNKSGKRWRGEIGIYNINKVVDMGDFDTVTVINATGKDELIIKK